MNDNILEPNINGYPSVTDWEKVVVVLQQANELLLRGASIKDLSKWIIGDVEIQGSDFVDLPVATSVDPVTLPIPTTGNKFGFLANGKYNQPAGSTLEYSETEWGLTLFDGSKWVKKFTLEMPKVAISERVNQWILSESYTIQSYIENSNGISSAVITFPDGQPGNITNISYDATGRISKMVFTYNSTAVITKTLTITYNNNQVQTSLS